MNINIKNITVLLLLIFLSCNKGIDDITPVDPGPDKGGPVISILRPTDGFSIQIPDEFASIQIEFKAEDDIELKSVRVDIDGQEIASYTTFTDYRIFSDELTFDQVTTGEHSLNVTATDLDGNQSTKTVYFSKAPPYTPVYEGEVLYMDFDGGFSNLVTFEDATEVGTPSFAGVAKIGTDAYQGAADSYLTFPTQGMLGEEFSATFWYKVNADPDRAGILVIGPPDEDNPDSQNNRKSGFRLFRENAGGKQRIKLNAGHGEGDSWFDGGELADIDPAVDEWTHVAFTISSTEAVVYINGEVVKQGEFAGIDWTGCDLLSIMSGAPRFTGWNHKSDGSLMDELRIFSKALTAEEIRAQMILADQILYMPFDGSFTDKISDINATEIGSPGFTSDAYSGSNAYLGATDSYLSVPTDGLLGSEFSAAFWYKVNAIPDRAGILVIGPPDEDNPDSQNNRKSGFRLFRENAGGKQRIKLNAGHGEGDSWFDGGEMADIDPTTGDWVHVAFTISGTECVVYFDGEVVKQGDFAGIDWTGCDIMSIMSGAPRFTGWNHLSDGSIMDDLRIFSSSLSQTDIQILMNN